MKIHAPIISAIYISSHQLTFTEKHDLCIIGRFNKRLFSIRRFVFHNNLLNQQNWSCFRNNLLSSKTVFWKELRDGGTLLHVFWQLEATTYETYFEYKQVQTTQTCVTSGKVGDVSPGEWGGVSSIDFGCLARVECGV